MFIVDRNAKLQGAHAFPTRFNQEIPVLGKGSAATTGPIYSRRI
jgi:hypothetical protein